MQRLIRLLLILGLGAAGTVNAAEYNPVRTAPVSIGPETNRIIVGFRATSANSVVQNIQPRNRLQSVQIVQARTTAADVSGLATRTGLSMARSRQLTPGMHVMFLKQTLYGTDVVDTLARLRADPAVEFADIDQRRYALSQPNDPLFVPTVGASGQWYMQTPTTTGCNTTTGCDLSATDAVSAWGLTTGTAGTVIADVDTGVRFDHPDLLRAGQGGRLLPGYDFVGQDENSSTSAGLGTYLMANDSDGWDPDPSDPGDWISSTDQQNSLFPSSNCPQAASSWHGTRVLGIFGAITNNSVGIAGLTWGAWILPVRALGKCGGYDSDIIAGIEWAAGMSVSTAATPVPNNPYPANIINLSLGGSGSCPSAYQIGLSAVTRLGVLVVASAGNESGSVETPANCSTTVPGVIAVAGLRNAGTKVGYSSFGPEVGISAPAGNCINTSGACLRSIDTTTNLGTTTPGDNSYTNELNTNLGTSFSAPIVAGIAGLMHSVNGNLTPAQLVARLEASATPFPANTGNLPVCPNMTTDDQCSCPASGECGTGMANALSAVNAALRPIAAVSFPSAYATNSSVVFNASGSAAACNRTIQSYAWTASGGLTITSGANEAQATVNGTGTLTLTVTDSQGVTDVANITVGSTSATSTAPASAGSNACPTVVAVTVAAPTVAAAFSPTTVQPNATSNLTFTFNNPNAFALTQAQLFQSLPTSLSVSGTGSTTTCGGPSASLAASGASIALTGAVIPASGSCSVTIPVTSTANGSYTVDVAANALTTGPAGGNPATATATLTVATASSHHGGALDWLDLTAMAGVLALARRRRGVLRSTG